MALPEVYGSGTTPVKSDTKRMLWAKALRKAGGTPLQSDTKRMLEGKLDQAIKGSTVKNNF
jgi:hypothetical protein